LLLLLAGSIVKSLSLPFACQCKVTNAQLYIFFIRHHQQQRNERNERQEQQQASKTTSTNETSSTKNSIPARKEKGNMLIYRKMNMAQKKECKHIMRVVAE